MARGNRWWNEPPLWAWITMVAGLVTIIVLLPIALDRTAPAATGTAAATPAEESVGTGSPPSASTTPSEDAGAARVVVLGDSDAAAWAAQGLEGATVEAVTTGDSGYVSTTAGGQTITDLVADADLAGADVVVLFGSRFDAAGISDQVSDAAQQAMAAVADGAPDATLVVIGPVWPGGAPPAGVRNNRDVIRVAAEDASARFVDPLAEGWLTEDAGLVAEDDVHLSAAGQAALADLVQPVVEEALTEGAPAGD